MWIILLTSLVLQQAARREVIVVTGSFQPVPLEEADRAVRLLEPRAEPAPLSNTLIDFLNLDSSVDLRQRAPNNLQTDLSIRGSTFGQTLVLLNGFRLNDAQSGHHNMDVPVPLEAIERIEVLKGSGSTLYGSDAVGGVIHFVAEPPEAAEMRLRTAAGSFGVNQQRASLGGAGAWWSQHLAFSRDFSSGFRDNRDYRHLSLSSLTRVRTRLGSTGVVLAHADRPFGADGFYGNFNSWERTRTWYGSVRQELGERTGIGAAFRRHTDLFVLYRDRPEVFTNRHVVESWQLAARRREDLGQNARLHYGVEALRDAVTSTNLGRHTRARAAGYAALDVRALRRFSFTVGAREEVYRSARGQFSPSASAGVWLSGHLKLRGGVSRAFRLPSFTDLYYHDPANLGSPDLRPETATGFEAGLDWNAGGVWRGEVTVFHRRETDGIDYVRASPADIWRATNFQKLRFTGLEAGVSVRARRDHRIDLQYTGLH
ncbi:MAG: TonB-dependent receptor plug domain-containing protein, partial [Bryobacteraceae bacterium]